MTDVVNLNRYRKRKLREAERAEAERNRVIHGRSKADKQSLERQRERAEQSLEGLRRERELATPEPTPLHHPPHPDDEG